MRRRTTLWLATLCLLMVLLAVSVRAQVPTLPHAFYGVVKVDGEPAPIGTEVEARGTGVLTGIDGNPLEVTEVGKYGGPSGFDPKLVVQGTIEAGTPIEFYVDGVRVRCAESGGPWRDSYLFGSGEVTELFLSTEGVNLFLPLVFRNYALPESSAQDLALDPLWAWSE